MTERMYHRRDFLSTAAAALAAAPLATAALAKPSTNEMNTDDEQTIHPAPAAPFGPLKQIDAGPLNIGYADEGPAGGKPVILLHGWPYDIHTYTDVAPILASKGYRVLVPYLRGYGTTRFLRADTLRNGQPSAIASDIVSFMDVLKINKAIVAGCDWGARTANIMAALWPERIKAMVSVSGYLIGSQAAGKAAAAAGGGAAVVVPILFCDRPRSCGL